MLFITNRTINESMQLTPGRTITFDYSNNLAGQSLYYCRRNADNSYTEVGSANFLELLRTSPAQQILVYIHGFNNQPEDDIFPRAAALQQMFDATNRNMVQVIPLIWPCDNDLGVVKDYWDDQKSADASAFGFARLMERFLDWQQANQHSGATPECLKRINVLAHSMGNRVFRETLERWARYDRGGEVPLLFRNSFLVAADIVNESLERGKSGDYICQSSRNVVVYFASDDLALRSSKAANLKNGVASRRLGHSGPENPDLVPTNVFMVDCDDINTRYDRPKGHAYFLKDDQGAPGAVFKHMLKAIETGRIEIAKDGAETTRMGNRLCQRLV